MRAYEIVGNILFSVLLTLSFVHFYWAFGGKSRLHDVIPSKDGKLLFIPSSRATFVVAILLLIAAISISERIGGPTTSKYMVHFHPLLARWGTWGISVAFFLRSIGDFNYIGFFKKHKGTHFAILDTRFYTPLCLAISIGAFYITIVTGHIFMY